MVLELEIEKQKILIKDIKSRETLLFEELKSKYGSVSINIETGEIS